MLSKMIDSHRRADCKGEILKTANLAPEFLLPKIFSSKFILTKAYGFKIHHNHPHGKYHDQYWDYFKKDRSIRIIRLKRRNILRTHLSEKISQSTNAFNIYNNDNRPDVNTRKVHLDTREVSNLQETYRNIENKYDHLFLTHDTLYLDYEDLVFDIESCSRKICNFLSIKEQTLSHGYQRLNPEPMKDLITNWEDIRSTLKGTKMEWMLDD